MKYGKYIFNIQFTSDARLPVYKGSTIRGVLGHALKRTVCALKTQECGSCIIRSNCAYALVFETAGALPMPENGRISAPPHPMVLEPSLTEKQLFSKGEHLSCGISLFGEMNRNLPYFVYAFDRMGRIGMGQKINGRRAGFALESIEHQGNTIFQKNQGEILMPEDLPRLSLQKADTELEDISSSRVTLKINTPLRISTEPKKMAGLPFHLLIRSLIRRCTALLNTYGPGEPEFDYPGLIRRAEEIRISDNRLSWFDWQRYSARQDRKMFMGGLVGQITYEGDLTPFMPFLTMGEKVNVGKNTAFGLGMIELKTND